MLPGEIVYLGLAFYAVGYYYYLKNMLSGGTKPNLVSWFLWFVAPLVGSFFQFKAGAKMSIIPVLSAGIGPLAVLILAFWRRNAYWQLTSFDLICGALATISLMLYVVTKDLILSTIFIVLTDFIAFFPTFKKSWTNPESETPILYTSSAAINLTGLLVIKNWSFAVYAFGLYLVIANIINMLILYRKQLSEFALKFVRNDVVG